jgi:hypothetical protein
VHPFDDLPVPEGPDPIESGDPSMMRAEILRLRESMLGANGRVEVLRDRVAELEQRESELDRANAHLHAELARNPVARIVGAVRRRLPGRA